MLRIGCVKYLNACPLIHGWEGDVDFDHPSALCDKLATAKLDVALVSSFEFLRNPIYRIVDNVSITMFPFPRTERFTALSLRTAAKLPRSKKSSSIPHQKLLSIYCVVCWQNWA